MVATAVMSMWISNTATAIILLPVAQSVVGLMLRPGSDAPATIEQAKRFAACLVLAIAYSASIGGSGTLIGSPPNLVVSGYVQQTLGCDIGVLTWMSFGIPAVLILLPLTWWYLTHVAFPFDADALPGGREQILREWNALGPMDRGERAVVGVFLFAAVAWMLRPQLAQWLNLPLLSDAGIAMAAAMALFIIPARKDTPTLDWETALRLPWGILLLFGGGLSLAAAISTHGVDQLIAGSLGGAATLPPIVLLLAVTVLVKFATELSSNTAVATAFTPVLASMALGLGAAPMPILIAIGLSANYAFMMPVATPPNAIAFSSGRVSIGQMARTGLAINLASIPIIALIASIAGSHICQ